MTPERLAEIRAEAAPASPCHYCGQTHERPEPAFSRWEVRDLLAEIDRLSAENERLRSELAEEHEARMTAVTTAEALMRERRAQTSQWHEDV